MTSKNMLMVSAVSLLALVATDALAGGKGLGRDGAPGQSAEGGQPDHAGGGKKGGAEGGGPGSPAGSGNSEPGDNPSGTAGNQGNDKDRGNAGGSNSHDNDDDDDHQDDDDDTCTSNCGGGDDDDDDTPDDVTPDTPRVTAGGGSGGNVRVCASGETVAELAPTMVGRDLNDRYLVLQGGTVVGFVDTSAMQYGLTYGAWTFESNVDEDTVCVDDVKLTLSEPAQPAPKSTIIYEGRVVNMNGS